MVLIKINALNINAKRDLLFHVSNFILLICISLFAFSCTQKSNNKSTGKNDTADVSKETNSVKSIPIVPKDTTELSVRKDTIPEKLKKAIQKDTLTLDDRANSDFVKIDIFKKRKYETNNFNPVDVLMALFPGELALGNPHSRRGEKYSVWSCASCPPRKFIFYDGVDSKYRTKFPLWKNVTTVLDEKPIIGTGTQYKYIFFNTGGEPGVGRFDGGFLGVARFKYSNSKWKLLNFDPAIDFLGTWGSAPKPDSILNLGNNKQGILIDGWYETFVDETPSYTYLKLYSLVNNKFKNVLFINYYGCILNGYPINDTNVTLWKSRIIVNNSSITNGYKNIKVITTGELVPRKCNKKALPDKSLLRIVKQNKSCKFRITRNYSFNGMEYKMISKRVTIY